MSTNKQMDERNVVDTDNGYYSAIRKEENSDTSYNMDES